MKGGSRSHIENREEKPVEEDDGEANVHSSPPRDDEGRAIEGGDLTPVESYETHWQALINTKQLVDLDIVRSNPAHPWKLGKCGEEVRGQEV
jgi:hypothetical protein